MATPPTLVRYIGERPDLKGLAGIAYIPTCLGDAKCEEEMKKRGQTPDLPFSFVPSIHGEPHFNTEFFVGRNDLKFGKYIWEVEGNEPTTDDYPTIED